MPQPGGKKLGDLLDRVERMLAEAGWRIAAPCAFFPSPGGGVTSLALPASRTETEREALAAIVLHHMLEIGADCCAILVPALREANLFLLDGHRIGRDGVHSLRRRLLAPRSPAGTSSFRLSA